MSNQEKMKAIATEVQTIMRHRILDAGVPMEQALYEGWRIVTIAVKEILAEDILAEEEISPYDRPFDALPHERSYPRVRSWPLFCPKRPSLKTDHHCPAPLLMCSLPLPRRVRYLMRQEVLGGGGWVGASLLRSVVVEPCCRSLSHNQISLFKKRTDDGNDPSEKGTS